MPHTDYIVLGCMYVYATNKRERTKLSHLSAPVFLFKTLEQVFVTKNLSIFNYSVFRKEESDASGRDQMISHPQIRIDCLHVLIHYHIP